MSYNNIMASEIELSTVISDIAAGPFGSNLKVSCFVPDGFPIIDGANLKGFKVTDNVTKFVTDEKAHSLERSIAHRGDVVSTISGTLGQIAYIPDDSKYEGYLCSQRQFRITFDKSKVYPPYIVFYFHTREGQHKILSFASQVGVPALAQPLKNFRKIKIFLPGIDEQKRIANIIEILNEKIETNNQINDNLEQQAAAMFRDLFITQADPSWTEGTISDLGTVVGGSTPSKAKAEYYTKRGIAWITPKDLSVDKSKFISHGADDITELGLENSSAAVSVFTGSTKRRLNGFPHSKILMIPGKNLPPLCSFHAIADEVFDDIQQPLLCEYSLKECVKLSKSCIFITTVFGFPFHKTVFAGSNRPGFADRLVAHNQNGIVYEHGRNLMHIIPQLQKCLRSIGFLPGWRL